MQTKTERFTPELHEVAQWRDRYIASFEKDDPDEATFWRNELSDPWAAEFWFDQSSWDEPIKGADLIKLV